MCIVFSLFLFYFVFVFVFYVTSLVKIEKQNELITVIVYDKLINALWVSDEYTLHTCIYRNILKNYNFRTILLFCFIYIRCSWFSMSVNFFMCHIYRYIYIYIYCVYLCSFCWGIRCMFNLTYHCDIHVQVYIIRTGCLWINVRNCNKGYQKVN